jgi:hypothetical protein
VRVEGLRHRSEREPRPSVWRHEPSPASTLALSEYPKTGLVSPWRLVSPDPAKPLQLVELRGEPSVGVLGNPVYGEKLSSSVQPTSTFLNVQRPH